MNIYIVVSKEKKIFFIKVFIKTLQKMKKWWKSCFFHNERLVGIDFEVCDSMQFISSLPFGVKSSKKIAERKILKNPPLIARWNISCGMLLSIWGIQTIINRNVSLLSNNLYTKMLLLTEMSGFRKQA